MKLEQLEYAIEIAKQKSVTKAANQLYLSQSALTKSMNRLEEELGVKLFDRLSVPVQMTPAGEYFLSKAEIIISQVEQLRKGMEQFSGKAPGNIRVGMGPGRAEYWTPFILPRFWEKHPEVQVDIITDSMLALEEKLMNHEIDLAVLPRPQTVSDEIHYEPICRERMLFTMAHGHPALSSYVIPADSFREPLFIRPETLNHLDFVTSREGFAVTKSLKDILSRNGIVPNSIKYMMSIDAAYVFSSESLAVSYVYESSRDQGESVPEPVFCMLEGDEESSIFAAAFRKDNSMISLLKDFVRITKETVPESNNG